MMTKAAINILATIQTGHRATTQDLVDQTGLSRRHITRVVDDLVDEGLFRETRQHHNQRVFTTTTHPVTEKYRALTTNLSHVDWQGILSPALLRVCWFLDEPRRIARIADRLCITRQAVYDALAPLKDRAMLDPAGPTYALTDDVLPLLEFARTLIRHHHQTHTRRIAPSATVHWCDPLRALIQPHEPGDTEALQADKDWRLTGLAKFPDYSLQFFLADEPVFWYAPDDLTPSEVICHLLTVGGGPRRASYAMFLIETQDIAQDDLLETADWYDLESTISEMYCLLDSETRPEDADTELPSHTEYTELKDQYGVA